MFVVAHVSDLHLDGSARAAERAERVVRYVAALDPPVDAIVVTGDVADHGAAAEYEAARTLFDLPVPVAVCPGNHDARGPYRRSLLAEEPSGEPSGEPVNRVHVVGDVVFAMCDSSIPGRNEGLLGDVTAQWLDAVLTEHAGRPAFVCLHHPPIRLRHPMVDTIRLQDDDRLAGVVRAHPDVVAVLCGHAHMGVVATFAGRPVVVAPGVASESRFDPREQGWVLDFDAPPALALHLLDDGDLVTRFRALA